MPTALRHRTLRRPPQNHRRLTRVTHNGHTRTFALSKRVYENLMEDLEALSSPRYLASIRRARREVARGKTYTLAEVKRRFGIR